MSALDQQVSGNHYKDLPIQPVEFIYKNNIGYLEGNVIKYICRHKAKNGLADLEKAKHYIELLIELEYGQEKALDNLMAWQQELEKQKPVTEKQHSLLMGALKKSSQKINTAPRELSDEEIIRICETCDLNLIHGLNHKFH